MYESRPDEGFRKLLTVTDDLTDSVRRPLIGLFHRILRQPLPKLL